MDYTLAIKIQKLIQSGNNTTEKIYSQFGFDTIQNAINEGYITKNDDFLFLTQKGMNLTRPVENSTIFDGNLICS